MHPPPRERRPPFVHDGRADHRVLVAGPLRQGFKDLLPYTAVAPAAVAQVRHLEVCETYRQIAPGDAGPVEQHGIDKQAVVLCSWQADASGQPILEALPLIVAQRVSSDRGPSSGLSPAGFKLGT